MPEIILAVSTVSQFADGNETAEDFGTAIGVMQRDNELHNLALRFEVTPSSDVTAIALCLTYSDSGPEAVDGHVFRVGIGTQATLPDSYKPFTWDTGNKAIQNLCIDRYCKGGVPLYFWVYYSPVELLSCSISGVQVSNVTGSAKSEGNSASSGDDPVDVSQILSARRLSQDVLTRLEKTAQAPATKAKPLLSLWISRPVMPLVGTEFLETQNLNRSTNVTACALTVSHPTVGKQATQIYIACVDNGVALVQYADWKSVMGSHNWVDTGFMEPATDVALAFDGMMPKDVHGYIEFVTEEAPWVFWVSGDALYAQKLGDSSTHVTLAENNCTAVTAVRAPWSSVQSLDYGLCVFYILSGSLYYRQFIAGSWSDAMAVSFGPEGVEYIDVNASRTWDYRVVLQVQTSTGEVYELFTQFAGLGSRNQEHISIEDVTRA